MTQGLEEVVFRFHSGLLTDEQLEEALYALAATELSTEQFVQGLMAKAYAETDGDEKASAARYLKLRVKQLRRDFDLLLAGAKAAAEQERREQERDRVKRAEHAPRKPIPAATTQDKVILVGLGVLVVAIIIGAIVYGSR